MGGARMAKRMTAEVYRMVEVTVKVVVNVRGDLVPGRRPFMRALWECVQDRIVEGDEDDVDHWEEV